jgi:hypothetical protein
MLTVPFYVPDDCLHNCDCYECWTEEYEDDQEFRGAE